MHFNDQEHNYLKTNFVQDIMQSIKNFQRANCIVRLNFLMVELLASV